MGTAFLKNYLYRKNNLFFSFLDSFKISNPSIIAYNSAYLYMWVLTLSKIKINEKAKISSMRKIKITLVTLFVFSMLGLFSQNQTDSIQIEKRLGTVYTQNGNTLTFKHLMEISKVNDEAYSFMKQARTNNNAAMVFSLAGGFLVGYPLGTALAGGDPNWVMAGIGAGLIIVGIPFSIGASKNAKIAVEIYNSGLVKPEARRINCNFGVTNNGIGIKVAF